VAVGDNKSTPKIVHKKGKLQKMKSNNTSAHGNRNSNNTT